MKEGANINEQDNAGNTALVRPYSLMLTWPGWAYFRSCLRCQRLEFVT